MVFVVFLLYWFLKRNKTAHQSSAKIYRLVLTICLLNNLNSAKDAGISTMSALKKQKHSSKYKHYLFPLRCLLLSVTFFR